MFGSYSYLLSILFFAGVPALFEWIFGFHLIKRYLKTTFITLVCGFIFTLTEAVALRGRIWGYNSEATFDIKVFGVEVETYVFTFFITIAISSAVIGWTYYEDKGKPILWQSIRDVLDGTYVLWGKHSFKK